MAPASSRLTALDGLKGIFAILVVVWHYFFLFLGRKAALIPTPDALDPLWLHASWSVELFFLLSGYLVAKTYRERIPSMSFPEFFGRRAKMAQPFFFATLFSIALILVDRFAVSGGAITKHSLDLQHILFSFLFIQSGWFYKHVNPLVDPLWFVCILFLCYAFYYAIVRLARSKAAYVAACAVCMVVGIALIIHEPDFPFFYYQNGKGYAGFFAGAILFELLETNLRWDRLVIPAALVLVAIYASERLWGTVETYGNFRPCCILVIYPAILLLSLKSRLAGKILSCAPLAFLGKISMALFATHWQIIWIWKFGYRLRGAKIPVSSLSFFLLFLASCLLFAFIWYETIEKRLAPFAFSRLKRALIPPTPAPSTNIQGTTTK